MKYSLVSLLLTGLAALPLVVMAGEEESDPAEIAIGERLFLETRFAQAYYANAQKADPTLDTTRTTNGDLRGPFAGKTMNCRSCHMVDEHFDNPLGGMRSYSDFAARPPVPTRGDGQQTSLRNSMTMVNISKPWVHGEQGALFHFDGEFNSIEDLVRGTLTGRNFGWLVHENDIAIKHIADVIRKDDGKGELAKEFGGSYQKVLTGTENSLTKEFNLPDEYRVDVANASDKQILDAITKLIGVYVTDLNFEQDEQGNYIASPYDVFLRKNSLPRQPAKDESITNYNQRLLDEVNKLSVPRFVNDKDREFETHKQKFVFGQKELAGMKLFFRKGNNKQSGGNCASCHTAPHFSDFGFHNTGLTQANYDATHGNDAFNKLAIPTLKVRSQYHNNYLPVTAKHPKATSIFRSPVSKEKPGATDLGLWSVFANPDMPAPQEKLHKIMCYQAKANKRYDCSVDKLLSLTVAAFKTPVLRDLGHAGPYMHSGQFNNIKDSITFYITASALAKSNRIRNAAPELSDIHLLENDVDLLVAFVNALNEDYD